MARAEGEAYKPIAGGCRLDHRFREAENPYYRPCGEGDHMDQPCVIGDQHYLVREQCDAAPPPDAAVQRDFLPGTLCRPTLWRKDAEC